MKWIEENRDSLKPLLFEIGFNSPVVPETKHLSLSRFSVQLQAIASRQDIENRSFGFAAPDKVYRFDLAEWTRLIVAHTIEQTIQNYIAEHTHAPDTIFFANKDNIPSIHMASLTQGGSFGLASEDHIPGYFSRIAYEKYVRSAAEKVLELVEGLNINAEEKMRFSSFLSQEIANYARSYQKVFTSLYQAYNVKSNSIHNLKLYLEKTITPGSRLQEFLQTIHYHTDIFSSSTPCIKGLQELNSMAFLDTLFPKQDGEKSIYGAYCSLVRELLEELGNKKEKSKSVKAYLTPAAKLSLEILNDHPESFMNRMHDFLSESGIPRQYHTPFTAPLQTLKKLGLRDLKEALHRGWLDHFSPKIDALFSKFPFDPHAQAVATFEEVEKILSPKESFLKEIQETFGSVSVIENGRWKPLDKHSELKPEIYETLNHLSHLGRLLWDSEGTAQPLRFEVQSVPFEAHANENPVMILSSLICGKELFRNFNQGPYWHEIKVNWWEPLTSAVAIELKSKTTGLEHTRTIQKTDMWSFYKTPQCCKTSEDNTWLWKVKDLSGQDARNVSIHFKSNPWSALCKQIDESGESDAD